MKELRHRCGGVVKCLSCFVLYRQNKSLENLSQDLGITQAVEEGDTSGGHHMTSHNHTQYSVMSHDLT